MMFQRVILERTLPADGRLVLRGFAGIDPILVELDTSARMKLSGQTMRSDQEAVEAGYDRIVRAVERLCETPYLSAATDDVIHILVSGLDLD